MRRCLTILTLAVLLGVFLWAAFFRPSPTVRAAKNYAKEFSQKIQSDDRFTNVNVRVIELGDKSPIWISGTVRYESDAAQLHQIFDSLHCPPGINRVSWNVSIATNQSEKVK